MFASSSVAFRLVNNVCWASVFLSSALWNEIRPLLTLKSHSRSGAADPNDPNAIRPPFLLILILLYRAGLYICEGRWLNTQSRVSDFYDLVKRTFFVDLLRDPGGLGRELNFVFLDCIFASIQYVRIKLLSKLGNIVWSLRIDLTQWREKERVIRDRLIQMELIAWLIIHKLLIF